VSANLFSAGLALGVALITIGCGLVSLPLGCVVGGVGLIGMTLLMVKVGGIR
jgi:hypothetical protein